jgi:tetratricopeptide (TPR) repeat protein
MFLKKFILSFAVLFLFSCASSPDSERMSLALNVMFSQDSIQNGRYDDAIQDLTNGIAGGPSSPLLYAAYFFRGMAFYATGEYDTAVEDFDKARQLAPTEGQGSSIKPIADIFRGRALRGIPFSKEMLQKITKL